MDNIEVFNPSIFDEIIPYITSLSPNGDIVIALPQTVAFDLQLIRSYFEDNVELQCVRYSSNKIVGTLKDQNVINYLSNKMTSVYWNFTIKWKEGAKGSDNPDIKEIFGE